MIERDVEYIVDADLLAMRIMEELPTNRGEAYYALSMALEMIESEKMPLSEYYQVEDSAGCKESLERCGHTSMVSQNDGKKYPHFNIQIEAYGVDDLREQIGDLFAYTYSEDFSDSLELYSAFEYDSESKTTRTIREEPQ